MSIKMIVSDLDGTLFNSSEEGYTISPKLIEQIDKFKKKGNIFTIATGRPEEASLHVIDKLGIDVPYIVYNGAKIIGNDGKELYSESFQLKSWLPFLEKLQEIGATIIFYHDGQVFCIKYTEIIHLYEKKEGLKYVVADNELLNSPFLINKILIIGDVTKYKECWRQLDDKLKNKFRYVISEDNYFEIVKKDVSKGSALKKLKKHLGIKDEEVLTIGNHMNDKELIEEAFIGVAVANAVEGLKNVADFITKGEYEEGVIEVIRKFS
jgi:Cof subfamily protein (haloacid dehalogenase superfamily)